MTTIIDKLIEHNTNPTIIGFLSFHPNMAETQDVDTWAVIGKIMDKNPDITSEGLSKYIGEGLTDMIMNYMEISEKLPFPKDILDGKITTIDPSISIQYAVVTSLCYELNELNNSKCLTKDELHEKADTFFRFIMDNLSIEMTIMAARTLLAQSDLLLDLTKLKTFDEFHEKYGWYVSEAIA